MVRQCTGPGWGEGTVLLNCCVLWVCWEDISRQERRVPLCGRCRLDCIHAAGFCGLIFLPSCPSLLLVPFKGENIVLQIAQLKKFSFLCLRAVGVNYLLSEEIQVLAQLFVVTCMSLVSSPRAELSWLCSLVFSGSSDLSPSSTPSCLFPWHLRSFLSFVFPPDVKHNWNWPTDPGIGNQCNAMSTLSLG